MGFRLLLLKNSDIREVHPLIDSLPEAVRAAVPDVDIHVMADDAALNSTELAEAEAIFGRVDPPLFRQAHRLRWIQSPQAGPHPKFYHPDLVESDVTVTNFRGIFGDHISAHILGLMLSFARGLHIYHAQQQQGLWRSGAPTVYMPEATVLIVGVGGIGRDTAKLCAAFGSKVIGIDARFEPDAPLPDGVTEMHRPEALQEQLGRADFVVVTVPETPETQGLFAREVFGAMKASGYFINIGRGATVKLDDLNTALRAGDIAGAALDVFEIEPLPQDHPLWQAPNMLITPHVATVGPYLNERRQEIVIENCKRFAAGAVLKNIVDKSQWY